MSQPTEKAILLCEDDEVMLVALDFRLRKFGYRVVRARNHVEAKLAMTTLQPALVVVDLFTPNLSGLDFIADLKANQPYLPILAMSTPEEGDRLLEALTLGAGDFILKPVNPTELLLRIRRLLLST
jgi:DNA-binding response OmpR family regulator